MAVLDTNILVDLMRKRPASSGRRTAEFVRRITASGDTLMTTRFNVAELYVGAELSAAPAAETGRIDAVLAAIRILEFDDMSARIYGRIEASLRRSGRPVGDFDALIAAVALRQGQTLVTRNPRHFLWIPGLTVQPIE